MANLIHYIIVRRDLPLGVAMAMVTHAAGESGALYDGQFKGATAVVLEARDERELDRIAVKLWRANEVVQTVEIYEKGGPYDNQFMAIGVVPGEREKLAPVMEPFQVLKRLDNPETLADDTCSCTNCQNRESEGVDNRDWGV